MRFRASEVAEATGGHLYGPDVTIEGAAFDTRELQAGQLFVPLVAERDGHRFIETARAAGAAAWLTAQPWDGHGSAIAVDDTLAALGALAADRRRRWSGVVAGITGSVGKTSTKDLALAALAPSRRTSANVKSYNNDFGLPTALLNAPDATEVIVCEMGMRGFGEIARLCAVAQPNAGLVTRVAEAHSERLGGIDGVALAKRELIEALPSDGLAVLNADDDRVVAMASATTGRVLTFGTASTADVHLAGLVLDGGLRPSCTIHSPWGRFDVRLQLAGAQMATNAAGAFALACGLGADPAAAADGLGTVRPASRRMAVLTTAAGATVLDDSYNANPTSVRAGLDALAAAPGRRRIAVLGVMAEIAEPEREHRAIADYAHARGVEVIPTGTTLYGIEPVEDPAGRLRPLAHGDVVLVKGSLVAGLDRVVAALLAD